MAPKAAKNAKKKAPATGDKKPFYTVEMDPPPPPPKKKARKVTEPTLNLRKNRAMSNLSESDTDSHEDLTFAEKLPPVVNPRRARTKKVETGETVQSEEELLVENTPTKKKNKTPTKVSTPKDKHTPSKHTPSKVKKTNTPSKGKSPGKKTTTEGKYDLCDIFIL